MRSLKLSDIIINAHSTRIYNDLLGKPIKTMTDRKLGIVEDLILNEYGAIKYVIVKQDNGLYVRLKAGQLRLEDDGIVLLEPQATEILDLISDLSMTLIKLVRILREMNDNEYHHYKKDLQLVRAYLSKALEVVEEELC